MRDQSSSTLGMMGFPSSLPTSSISLPKVSPPARLSASPVTGGAGALAGGGAGVGSGLSQMMKEGSVELVGKQTTVASWNVKRSVDWKEVRMIIKDGGKSKGVRQSK